MSAIARGRSSCGERILYGSLHRTFLFFPTPDVESATVCDVVEGKMRSRISEKFFFVFSRRFVFSTCRCSNE